MTTSNRVLKKWDKSHFLVEQVKVELVSNMQPNTSVTASRLLIDPAFWGLLSTNTFF